MKECARLDFFSMCVLTHWDAPTQFFVAATANLHQKPKTGRQTSNVVTQEKYRQFCLCCRGKQATETSKARTLGTKETE